MPSPKTPSPQFYVDEAVWHLEAASGSNEPKRRKQALRLALEYLGLAELAKKNSSAGPTPDTDTGSQEPA